VEAIWQHLCCATRRHPTDHPPLRPPLHRSAPTYPGSPNKASPHTGSATPPSPGSNATTATHRHEYAGHHDKTTAHPTYLHAESTTWPSPSPPSPTKNHPLTDIDGSPLVDPRSTVARADLTLAAERPPCLIATVLPLMGSSRYTPWPLPQRPAQSGHLDPCACVLCSVPHVVLVLDRIGVLDGV